MIFHADDSTFENQVLGAIGPVLVEFFTQSCGPCKQLEPFLQKLAINLEGCLKIVKIDSEKSRKIVNDYNVKISPTFIIFIDGQTRGVIQGAPPPHRLASFINSYL